MIEEWRDIPGFEEFYQASNTGKIRSVDREVWRADERRNGGGCWHKLKGVVLKQKVDTNRYNTVCLKCADIGIKCKVCLVHRLVWMAFNGSTEKDIHHIDGNRFNNCLDNLEAMSKEDHRQLTNSDKIGGQDWLFAMKGKSSAELHEKVKEYGQAQYEEGYKQGREDAMAEFLNLN